MNHVVRGAVIILAFSFFVLLNASWAQDGPKTAYQALEPLSAGNLTIFPIILSNEHPSDVFLTLDEGLASNDVVLMERGPWEEIQKLRSPGIVATAPRTQSAAIGKLVVVNKSRKPLLLLAGEVLTGGKQDRVVGQDHIIAPQSGAVDLDVFCVELHRWSSKAEKFGASASLLQPSVRLQMIGTQNQIHVWRAVDEARKRANKLAGAGNRMRSSSYVAVLQHQDVRRKIDELVEPIQRQFEARKDDLRFRNAVGVVVAIDAQTVLWADLFASTDLLEKYFPKLLISYAAEAITRPRTETRVGIAEVEQFLQGLLGNQEQSAIARDGYNKQDTANRNGYGVSQITSRFTDDNYVVHTAVMYEDEVAGKLKGQRRFHE